MARPHKAWKLEFEVQRREFEKEREKLNNEIKALKDELLKKGDFDNAEKNELEREIAEKEDKIEDLKNQNHSLEKPSIRTRPTHEKARDETDPSSSINNSENELELDQEPKNLEDEIQDREPNPDDYKQQCGECGAYFNEFEEGTKCPNCKTDWSNELNGEKEE